MCLNDHFDIQDMIRLFGARTTNPQVAKSLPDFFLHI